MSAYKQFLASDIIVTPFEVNKNFTFIGASQLTGSNVGIDRYLGTFNTSSVFVPSQQSTTGQITSQYQSLVYNSVKQLYYTNYLSSSFGDNVSTASIFPGADSSGDTLVGSKASDGRFWNYPQTDLTFTKNFPTGSFATVGVMSVPVGVFGEYIQPKSFVWKAESGSITDDGEGNLVFVSSSIVSASIFTQNNTFQPSLTPVVATLFDTTVTPQGLNYNKTNGALNLIPSTLYSSLPFTFTFQGTGTDDDFPYVFYFSSSLGISTAYEALGSPFTGSIDVTLYPGVEYYLYYYTSDLSSTLTFNFQGISTPIIQETNIGNIFYGHGIATLTNAFPGTINNFVSSANVSCSFSSSVTIYETQYKCTIRDNEYNFSLNPSLTSGSTAYSAPNGTYFTPGQYLVGFATASYFNPYVTTIGLYDDNQNLLAIGKLAQPLPLSPTTDTTILINLDR